MSCSGNCKCKKTATKAKKIDGQVIVKYKILHADAKPPLYKKEGDAGADVCCLDEIYIQPHSRKLCPLGFSMEIPEGYEVQVRSRSGLAINQGVVVLNSPGTVDCVPKGTLISTSEGDVPVETIFQSNDHYLVLSYNENEHSIEEDILEDIWTVEDVELVEIETMDGHSVTIPLDKELFTRRGWITCRDLTINDEVLSI